MSNEMPKDIAAELRVRAAIEQVKGSLFERAAAEIERLRAERDAARSEVCLLRASSTTASDVVDQSMADYAESRGWKDLFRENTDDR